MKVIKRDGRAVDYDRAKIQIAIEKANEEVNQKERATNEEIKEIIIYIESLNKKRMLVEDIQDIIEEKLMELGKYELSKKYIVYRYTRALVRKQNTTDESILGLIRNENKEFGKDISNKNILCASTQRDYIAGEVSRDLTKRLLLPEKISKADEDGILHFHDADYFVQPIFNCCIVNIGDMLDNGTVMNGKLIESPKTFQGACVVTTQIIAAVACNQYGGQAIDMNHFGKYLRRSYDTFKQELEKEKGCKGELSSKMIEETAQNMLQNELRQGIQTIQYQINTLMVTNGHEPFITLFLHLEENDPYIKENAMIIEEILKQKYQGIKNEEGIYITPEFPKLVYVLDEHNCLKGGEYDYLTKLAIKCSTKKGNISFISAKKMRENYERNVFSPMGENCFLLPWKDEKGNYKFEGRFNQGVVSINLPQVAIVADGDEEKFWELLDERLEVCKEALMCRHYSLVGTTSDISPIHWQHGVIARLEKGEKIDKFLYGGYSTISLGYIGIYEMTKVMKGVSHTTPEGREFALKVMKHLKETVERWKKETNIGFALYAIPSQRLGYEFARIDKEKFGTIKDVTDKGYYTNSYHVDVREKMDIEKKILFESEFQKISSGGTICYVEVPDLEKNLDDNFDKVEHAVKIIYDNVLLAEFED